MRGLILSAEAELRRSPHPERARLDAETLLLHLVGQGRAWLLAHSSDGADEGLLLQFETMLARRLAGEPIQYITGVTEFFGLPFIVSPDVLIPRPETEHLVEEVLRLAASFEGREISIADIGTGSGAIAVALAHALPNAKITAIDISPAALTVARRNARENKVSDRIEFLHGDLLEPLAGRTFQIIASNPPYVPIRDLDSLSVEVREHEPHLALFAEDDGLSVYRRLIPQAYQHLDADGWLLLEIGYGQQAAIEQSFASANYREVQFIPDYQGIARVATANAYEDAPRQGWAEDAKQLAASGDDALILTDFGNEEDAKLDW